MIRNESRIAQCVRGSFTCKPSISDTHEPVMSSILMRFVTQMNESCHKWIYHVAVMPTSCGWIFFSSSCLRRRMVWACSCMYVIWLVNMQRDSSTCGCRWMIHLHVDGCRWMIHLHVDGCRWMIHLHVHESLGCRWMIHLHVDYTCRWMWHGCRWMIHLHVDGCRRMIHLHVDESL